MGIIDYENYLVCDQLVRFMVINMTIMLLTSLSYQLDPGKSLQVLSRPVSSSVYVRTRIRALYLIDNRLYITYKEKYEHCSNVNPNYYS